MEKFLNQRIFSKRIRLSTRSFKSSTLRRRSFGSSLLDRSMGVDVPEFVVRLLISSYSRALTRLSERIPAWRINNLRGALNERVRVMFNGRARDRASDPSKTCLIKKKRVGKSHDVSSFSKT